MQSTGNWTRDYIYDSNNTNRLIKHDPQQTLPDYTYDSHGNMLQMPGIATMEWDYENRLFKAISGTVASFYNYDAGGERARKVVEKTGQNIKEVRIYFSNFEVYRKYVSNVLETERTTLHISDGQRRIAFFESLTVEAGVTLSTAQDTVRYQYDNHLGSASLVLDQTAATISYEEYHPFGTSSYRLHRNSTEASLKRYRYVGKERDEETGLYYYGARYYAAWIARFVSVDPLQHKYPHYTPYQYAGNKPVTFIDLDGLEEAKADPEIEVEADVKKGDPFIGDDGKTYYASCDSITVIGDFRIAGAQKIAEMSAESEGLTLQNTVMEIEKWANVIEELDPQLLEKLNIKKSAKGSALLEMASTLRDVEKGKKLTPANAMAAISGIGVSIGLYSEYVVDPALNEIEETQNELAWKKAQVSWGDMGDYSGEYNKKINPNTALFIYAGKSVNQEVFTNVIPTTEFITTPQEAEDFLGFVPDKVFVGRFSDVKQTKEGMKFIPSKILPFENTKKTSGIGFNFARPDIFNKPKK